MLMDLILNIQKALMLCCPHTGGSNISDFTETIANVVDVVGDGGVDVVWVLVLCGY